MKKMLLVGILLVSVLCLQSAAAAAPKWLGVSFGDYAFHTTDQTAVYDAPNSQAKAVGTLENDTDGMLNEIRILYEDRPDANGLADCIDERWWRISKPVAGWIKEEVLGLGGDFIGGVLEVPGDFEEINP